MPNTIGSLTRAATRKPGEPLNILCAPTHEAYETNLCRTGHNFYAFRFDFMKDWDAAYRQPPPNYTLLKKSSSTEGQIQFPSDIDFDLVLSQSKFGQHQLAERIANTWHIPLVSLEHTLPYPWWEQGKVMEQKKLRGDINVFISEFSRDIWGWNENEATVIHHGIDTDVFKPNPLLQRKPHCLSVVNDWKKRDWCCGYVYWQNATEGLPVFVKGATPGLSEAAKTLEELVWCYQSSLIFVNTSMVSPIPMSVLEAMACGCCVVSTNTCMIPSIIIDGENGFLCETPSQMKTLLQHLLAYPGECRRVGEAARQTIEERFGLQQFVNNWNGVFSKAAEVVKFGGFDEKAD